MRRKSSYTRLIPVMLLIMISVSAIPALAHPAPSVIHDYIVTLTPNELTVESYLRVSPELVPEVYRTIDTDGDGKTSQDESEAWFRNHPQKLVLTLDGVQLKPTLSQAPSISREDLITSIDHPIGVTYTAKLPAPIAGKHRIQVTYGDNYTAGDEYYISVAKDTANDNKPQSVARPKYPATYQIVYHIPTQAEETKVVPGIMAPRPYYQGMPTVQPTVTATPVAHTLGGNNGGGQNGFVDNILQSLRSWRGEFWSGLGLIGLAMLIGALHALTPGHGKAMVAAYLIGSRGRVRDAVLLGGVVTFTHTIGVVLLGMVLLMASNFTMPRGFQPTLELVSGALVLILGLYLLVTRWRVAPAATARPARVERAKKARRTAGALPEKRFVPERGTGAALATATQTLPTRAVKVTTNGTPANHPTTHIDYTHDSHDHDHELHTHAHDNNHTHTHGGATHSHAPLPANARWGVGSLIGLGISGGIVPCPDALAILLLAAGVGQFALGLGLVVSFSIGLAVVLIALGIVLVRVKGTLDRSKMAGNPLWTRWVPVASAAIVVVIGTVMIITSLGALSL